MKELYSRSHALIKNVRWMNGLIKRINLAHILIKFIGIHHSEFVGLFNSQLPTPNSIPPTPEKKAAILYFSERFELRGFVV